MSKKELPPQHGKQRLLEAALQLSADKRSFGTLGIREITREAGLSAPAFYRHFGSLEDLGFALIQMVKDDVLKVFNEVRKATSEEEDLDIRPMLLSKFFDYVLENPRPVIVGACEAYGPMREMRESMRQAMRSVAEDLAQDPRIERLVPELTQSLRADILAMLVQNVFFMSMDYLEHPKERDAIKERAEKMVMIMFAGARMVAEIERM